MSAYRFISSASTPRADNRRKDINLVAVTPVQNQDCSYSETDKNLYRYIPKHSLYQIIISQEFSNESYLRRNDYMLQNSSYIISYYDGQSGGTMYTINRAKQQGPKIINLL